MDIKIFIGSSSERLEIANWVKEIIEELQLELPGINLSTLDWWDPEAFPIGKSFYESLFNILDKIDAAIFIAGGEDLIIKREKKQSGPRDNIILEFGLVEGRKGRGRALLGIVGLQTLPSDLEGINQRLFAGTSNKKSFKSAKAQNVEKIKDWILQVAEDIQQSPQLFTYFPLLSNALQKTILNAASAQTAFNYSEIDASLSDILSLVTSTSDDNTNITSSLVDSLKIELPECKSILAIDVMGPKAWITPVVYRYLATQIIYYLRKNLYGDQWMPVFSEELFNEILQACSLLKSNYNLDQSLSGFSECTDFKLIKGEPKLEFARVLLWSKKELLSSLGDSVVAIHQAFNVPLFFKPVEPQEELRDLDFILFQKDNGDITGFYSSKITNNKPERFEHDNIPGVGSAKKQFYSLFEKNKLMLAVDARAILRKNPAANLD